MGENGDRERVAIALWDCEYGEPWPPTNDLTRDIYLARAGRAIAALRATPAPTGSLAEVIDEITAFTDPYDPPPSPARLRKWRHALLSVGDPEPVTDPFHIVCQVLSDHIREHAIEGYGDLLDNLDEALRSPESTRSGPGVPVESETEGEP
jgi:hypothetical protein